MTNVPESRDEEKESARSGRYIEKHSFTMVVIHEAYIGLETHPPTSFSSSSFLAHTYQPLVQYC